MKSSTDGLKTDLKAVLLDFAGTLDSDGIAWKERFYPIYRRNGVRWSGREFEKRFFAADDFLTDLRLDRVSYLDTIRLQVALVLREGGRYDRKTADRIAGGFYRESLRNIRAKIPLLKKLSRRYRLGLVSNYYGNLETCLAGTGILRYFGVVADSNCVGCVKPDPRLFRFALKKLKASPAQAVFVGDSVKRDMRGALGLGMRHIWIKGKHPQWDASCCPEDPVIGSLPELEKLLL